MKSLYIHIPFCARKCFYCSFVIAVGQERRIEDYLQCLEREARRHSRTQVQSVFFGGGTPTLMNNTQLEKLLMIVRAHFRMPAGAEVTIESNPEGLDPCKLKLLKENGVSRISLGVQSLNDRYLKYLGRNHDAQSARQAFENIRQAGFDNVSVDLMFGFPNQTFEELNQDVDAVIRLNSDHLSLYALTIEEHSRFFAQKIKLNNDEQAHSYAFICEKLEQNGFRQYEVSNFACPRKESQHNMHYWRGGEYVGLGIGAHSFIGDRRSWNVARLNDYLQRMQRDASVEDGCEILTAYDRMMEALLFGLRMNDGVDLSGIERRFEQSLDENRRSKIEEFIRNGFLTGTTNRLRTSPKGRLVLDELCAQLF